jgi:FAD/FMN-containing dehydrogenase
VRWQVEKVFGEHLTRGFVSRNQLLNEDAGIYQEQNVERTDILQEYFIPPNQVLAFLQQARAIIPKHDVDLLNVTVRTVQEDTDTFLRYADQNLFSFVMSFNQTRTSDADREMERMTQKLIDATLQCSGRFYLPYRLHATSAQLHAAYPQVDSFFDRKRHFDPEELFKNQFYAKYGER